MGAPAWHADSVVILGAVDRGFVMCSRRMAARQLAMGNDIYRDWEICTLLGHCNRDQLGELRSGRFYLRRINRIEIND